VIEIPEDGWGLDANDAPTGLLGGRSILAEPFAAPDWHWGDAADDDPVAYADTARQRAGGVLQRQRSIGAFNRGLDELTTSIAGGADWAHGLERYDREIEALRERHGGVLRDPGDRDAFARHAGEFAAMQRIGLKRALVERQAGEALGQLDEQLGYYAGKAAEAGNDVFRQIATDGGLRAIDELREAGYLTPESAEARKSAFLGRIDGADVEALAKVDPNEALGALGGGLFARLDPETREKLRADITATLTGGGSSSGDIAAALAPIIAKNDGLRELLEEMQANPDDPGALIQLAAGLLDSGSDAPEASLLGFLRLLLSGRNLPKRPPRLPAPRKRGDEPDSPAPVLPPRAKPPLVPPPTQDEAEQPDASTPRDKSEEEISTARALWKEKGFKIDQFGPVFEDLRGDWKEGIQRLLKEQDGEVPEALTHPLIEGGIDLIWGEAGTGKGDGYGLAKIAKFHPEVLDGLPDLIADMQIISRSKNRVRLESPAHQAVIRLEFDGRRKTWLLTAFEKEHWALRSAEDGQAEPHGRTDSSITGPAKDKD
jgi:hypothetical protein